MTGFTFTIPTTVICQPGAARAIGPVVRERIGRAVKKGVVAAQTLPGVAVLDAELTLGLPAPVKAATGVAAMVHAIEAYTLR